MISTWAALAPRLFLPLGLKSLFVPLLRGVADAARDTGHERVTLLVGGITGIDELRAFRGEALALGLPRAGAFLQSPAAVAQAESPATATDAIWIDIREVIRTFHGYPSALSFGDDVFEAYVAEGYLRRNPGTELGPHLKRQLGDLAAALAERPGLRLGVDCGDGNAISLIEDLYDAGFRTFSIPVAASAKMRLALGQFATRTDDHA